ncbi:MAG: SPOR domain-containing protein [Magnetococcales bacterium]|nr:SPOR domain-containing protein [Magnetococcales bacterium]
MKISPNREQFMLFMIMNGLIFFMIAALSVESLLSARPPVVRSERPVVAADKGDGQERQAATPSQETKPEPRNMEEVLRSATPPQVKPLDGPAEHKPDIAKSRPPIPGLAALAQTPATASTPLPPPKPPLEESQTQDKATPAEGNHSVQLGAFSSEEKAAGLIAKLAAVKLEGKPLPVSQQPIKVGNKTMYRVRLGPFPSAARAKLAAGLVSRQAGVEGTVLGPGQ